MKSGKAITYVDATGTVRAATCADVVGTGNSGCKILDVSLGEGDPIKDVPHRSDAAKDTAYWQLATDPAPESRAP